MHAERHAASDEALRRFVTYVESADPSNLDARDDDDLRIRRWALVHEPEALSDHFVYEHEMRERAFVEMKSAYVHTVIATAAAIVAAYLRERSHN